MRLLIFSIAMFLLEGSCDKKSVETMGTMDGVYKGIFGRSSPNVRYATSKVTLTIKGNRFNGEFDNPKYPAICSGTLKLDGSKITVENECMFTADFDWSLIFKGDYQYELIGNELTITKSFPNSIQDRYVLVRQ